MVRNLTKKRIIIKKSALIGDAFSKFIGLMFSKRQDKALILKFNKEKAVSLHMLFVFYPIDVLFLDKNKAVVDKKENFIPFTFCKSRKGAMFAIELPEGKNKKARIQIGDKLEF